MNDSVTGAPPRLPLDGITVIDLSTTMPGAQATQFLVEAGADVILVEPPAGHPLRSRAAWPAVSGGKHSVVLEAADPAALESLRDLVRTADVCVCSVERGPEDPPYLSRAEMMRLNPGLVLAVTSAWGPSGPLTGLRGDPALVMARLGLFHAKARLSARPGPNYVSVPFAEWGAAQLTVLGILAALVEREASGAGQLVETDLVRGLGAMDVWGWYTELVGLKWPGAFEVVDAYTADGEPLSFMIYALLAAPTRDGRWLQFAQTDPRLLAAFIEELGLKPLLADPGWAGFPRFGEQSQRTGFWELMIEEVGRRTLAEWQQVFDSNPNVSAELFRRDAQALDHPQLQHDGRAVTVDDPERGPVRRPSALVHAGGHALAPCRPAPLRGECSIAASFGAAGRQGEPDLTRRVLPLAGVTVLEFGVMFAAPFGSTLLTELGARVIKIETLEGDTIRNVLPFPEVGGARVMQGKESIQLDLGTPQGRDIVYELARRSDIVLQPFRAGAAERAGVDEKSMLEVNPDLIYVNAPGYGTSGPWAGRPAYAPSVAAAVGIALADAPDAADAVTDLASIKKAAVRLNTATAVPAAQADGLAAVAVASTMLLGWYARVRGRPLKPLTVTMLATGTHAMLDHVVDFPGRPPVPRTDPDGYGLSALYRLYPAATGWIFLAAAGPGDWPGLVAGLAGEVDLAADPRFGTAQARSDHDAELASILGGIFARAPAEDWEKNLTGHGVGCVQAAQMQPPLCIMTDEAMRAEYAATTTSPVFEEHLRMGPAVRFSRSLTQAKGGCRAGEHTVAILQELGYPDSEIEDLRDRNIIASR